MEDSPVAWSKLEHVGTVPTKRSGHTLTMLGSTGYLFGGIDLKSPPGPCNDLYSFEIGANEISWTKIEGASGICPPARWRHTATAISKTQILIFGGFQNSTTRLNDLHVFDTVSKAWTQPVTASVSAGGDGAQFRRVKKAVQATKQVVLANTRSRGEEEEKKGEKGAAPAGGSGGAGVGNSSTAFLEELGVPVNDPLAQDANPDAPTPRGAHSAVMVGEYVYIFGGYGGVGYARRDFNDLCRLHVPTMTWAKTDPTTIQGEPPAPRSGHTAMACQNQVLVFGGWSSTSQYNDLHAFNTETMTWTPIETGRYGPSRWNHTAVSVVAVPYWQIFIYGGSGAPSGEDMSVSGKDKGSYLGDMLLLNTGDMTIKDITDDFGPVGGTAPRPRADSAMVYDAASKRLILFGGWANRWHNDTHALSVAPIVGPPYAVLGLRPHIGPITGGQPLTVEGMGFEMKTPATVRFIMGKKFVEAPGEAKSTTEMEVTTPSFEHIGPGTVDIRCALRGGLLTITHQKYSFFNVVDSKHCYAFGPGVLSGCAVNVPTQFYIQARDTANSDRTTGTDEFAVQVIRLKEDGTEGKEPEYMDGVTVKDEDNGRYLVTYLAPASGGFHVHVEFKGTYGGKAGPIRGSPFKVVFSDDGKPENNKMTGSLVFEAAKELIESAFKTASETLTGITKEVPHDSLDILLSVKNQLTGVVTREPEVRLKLDAAAGILAQVKRDGSRKPKEIDTLLTKHEKALETWEDARKESPKCKAAIAPLVKTQSTNTRKEIEAFESSTVEYAKKTDTDAYWKFESGVEASIKSMDDAAATHSSHMKRVERMQFLANTFEFPAIMNEINKTMKAVADDLEDMRRVWNIAKETREFIATAKAQLWSDVKPEDLEENAKNLQKKLKTGGTKKTRASASTKGLDKQIRDFLSVTPLIAALRHKSMRPRHWDLLMKATKKTFTPPHLDAEMKLQNLLDLQMHEYVSDVEEICDQAVKEEKMEETLVKLDVTWKDVNWVAEPYKEGSPVMLLKLGEEDFETLEGDQLGVQGMMASRYLATFEVEITGWQKGLAMVSEVLLQLTDIQRKWAYLEPLFIGSDEVRRELMETAQRFEVIDKDVKKNLAEMHATKNVKAACNKTGLFEDMERITTELDVCEKALADFLNGKRRQFPRFYFVSKSDLLDILSNGSNPYKILQHVNKVFLQTDTLSLEGGNKGDERPTAIKWTASVGTEEVMFQPPVHLTGKVEIYMQTILDAQRSTLKYTLSQSVNRYPTQQRTVWLNNKENNKPTDPAQISLLVSGMQYVKSMDASFDALVAGQADAMKENYKRAEQDLADLVRLTMTNLSKPDRTRVMCMITLDAHGRDIIQKMILENVPDKQAFQWQSQIKQYWINNEAKMHIADARFDYSFEYLGNGPRLVVTPLTDRIYVTATQALNLKMGCAPAGPAGTGKTESTKDLANALAITCYVFNCFPESDHQLLTNKGFMYLKDVEAYHGNDLLFASYSESTGEMVYEKASELVVKDSKTRTLVEMTQTATGCSWDDEQDSANHMSLVATAGHRMYARHGRISSLESGESQTVWDGKNVPKDEQKKKWAIDEYSFIKAGSMLENDGRDAYKFLDRAAGGLRVASNYVPDFMASLGIEGDSGKNAFLDLYGLWLGRGSLAFNANDAADSVCFSTVKDIDHVLQNLSILHLVQDQDFSVAGPSQVEGTAIISIIKSEYVDLFAGEFEHNMQNLEKKSVKCFASWVWDLPADDISTILDGLRRANGAFADDESAIYTSCDRFRDEIVRLALHAGFAPHFIAQNDSWKVSFAGANCETKTHDIEPVLVAHRDVKSVERSERVWCARMPHDFVIVRRASSSQDGVITKASVPIIAGNCAPEMDYTSLGNIFKGLAASGSWGCFDEFNRLVPEVLSVCSVQFKAVCDGIRAQRRQVVIEGDEVSLLWTAGAFITMNPGYLGRSELPEGLKSLFRPITVMVPDLVLICENMLMAEGFIEAKILASKFYSLYSLLRELLSKQMHYDWGLRAIKSVLVVAGSFKRAEPDLLEQALLCRALRDFNIPKIVKQDEVIFFGLLGDLFPGIEPPRKVDPVLEEAVLNACHKRGLDPDEFFRLKVVQLEELLVIRHCVFVMGPAAAGKSQCWQTLQTARLELKRKTKAVDLDPKAVSPEELYGYIHPATREWRDGLLSKIMRDLGAEPGDDPKWILLDGDLDANWIESMNSVMDDNKMLTLASNERIPLKGHMRMVFEIRDLNHATPATVSRAGIIYISTNTGSQWRSLVKSWLVKLEAPEPIKVILKGLFERYCAPTLLFIKKECKPMVPVEDVTLVTNLLRLIKCLFTPAVMKKICDPATPAEEATRILDTYFVFAAVWAFGSALSVKDGEDYRIRFSDFWKGEFKTVKFQARDTVFDYWLDPNTLQFDQWKNSPHFNVVHFDSRKTAMSSVTVPTPETCSVTYWMEQLVVQRDPVMLVGYAGCGKTALVSGLLSTQKPEERLSHVINFNYFTDSRALQVIMEAPLEKKTGTNFGPPGKASLVYYLDDFNLPEVDKYDTQSAIALVREHFDYGHWYDRGKLQLRNILNCQYIASMNPTAGSFVINPRMQRHFFTLAIGFPGPTSLHTIYSTFLEGHLKNFSEEVQGAAQALLGGALQLHTAITGTFRKSAQNFHYEFNIRHLANVFQGLLMAQPDQFKTQDIMAMLWLHESERVYGDRLVSIEDLGKYRAQAAAQAKKRFPTINLGNFFGENADPLVFSHFAQGTGDKIYDRVTSMDKLRATLDESLREHNETYAAMNLVLFEDAMKHVCRISRIILNPSGHALLVGVGGSGKQSLSRLASFICGYKVYQITISGNYGLGDLKEDLKKMYMLTGVKEEGVTFLFTDSQITNERFLVCMNDLLASGNIPDLYATDEVDNIVNAMVSRVKAAGINPDRTNCWKFFIDTVKKNLHVVLCFSPVGEDMKTRAKRFPALVNCTVIDWFQPWPKDALHSVGVKFLKDIENIPDAVREGIEKFMPFSFETVNKAATKYKETDRRFVYTTPKSYLELLKLYKQLLSAKRKESNQAIERLANGLQKLRETGAAVAKIEEELKIKLAEAEIKKGEAAAIATDVAANKAIVEEETNKANAIASEASEVAGRAKAIKDDAERDLAAALPAVEAAMAALNTLNKKDLGECKTMQKPPAGVDDVFAAVAVLLAGVNKNVVCSKAGKVADKDRTWEAAKKQLLGDISGFLQSLMDYKQNVDSNTVPEGNFKDVRMYLEMPHFNPEVIRTKNAAAAGLVSWVVNIVGYRDIVVTVEPKKAKAAQAKQETDEAMAKKGAAEAQVAELTATLNILQKKFAEAEASKAAAESVVERGKAKADLANRLTNALADENVRWAASIETLNAEQEMLIGDVLLASCFISYIGPFTKKYRDVLMNETWMPFLETAAAGNRIPMNAKPDPLSVLTTEAQVATWNSEGLPDDKVSIENGCIVSCTARWPLMIDPQLQGITWVRQKEAANDLVVLRLEQKDMIRKLKNAIEKGLPVLIENMGERIDAVLGPVISRSLTKKGSRMSLKLGDDEVEYNPKFRLYMHTKLSNPHYPPEVQAEACLVNFTVTEAGLEDQLLVLTVAKERPDLAAIKKELIKQQNAFKIQMKELEDGILKRLADAQGDITDDRDLIENLENTKRIANDIAEKQIIAKATEVDINVTSEKYRPVAHRAALLFFLMNDLFRVHSYYIYSLNAFVTIFIRSIDLVSGANDPMRADEEPPAPAPAAAEGGDAGAAPVEVKEAVRILTDDELVKRCEILKESANFTSFKYMVRGMFERDKLTVATQLCLKLLLDSGELSDTMVRLLVVGPPAVADPGSSGPLAEWLPETIWPKVKALESVKPVFEKLGDDMQNEAGKWKQWFDDEKPETAINLLPGDYKTNVQGVYLLLLLRATRPDRLVAALSTYVSSKLGTKYVVQEPYDMAATYAESSRATPMFFVLFPGVDPTVWVEGLGNKIGYTVDNGRFVNISMGQGQEAPAMVSLQNLAKNGGWIMLQNVHLMQSWLPSLERQLELVSESAHEDFRCFISAEPPPLSYMKNMPESLMQACIKVANEAPADLLSNLTRSWANFSQERISSCAMQTEFKACLFTLTWYHSIVLGRRRFGSQGWSRKYSFNTGDMTVCANVLFEYINNAATAGGVVPWQDLQYIFGEIMYGGHITDAWDRRTNNTYLQVYLTPATLQGFELGPGFPCPPCHELDYEGVGQYIRNKLPRESPPMFGLHPNAEIGYLTAFCEDIFFTILSLGGGSGGGGGGGGGGNAVRSTLNDLLERLPENFGMIDIEARATPLLLSPSGPYVIVAMQECARMNDLLDEIRRSLLELRKGLDGSLNMSEPMEDLATCLSINMVPGRNPFHKCSWEKFAWPSRRGLASWFVDLLRRVEQLSSWSSALITPMSLWLPGIFNPMAILTAIQQVTARSTGLPLDKMAIDTHVTTLLQPEEALSYPEHGLYCHGLFMEGARWTIGEEAGAITPIAGTNTAGFITESRLKQLLPPMPLLYLRAVPVQTKWIPSGVGYLRQDPAVYECPVYTTTFRGPTYVFLATLNSRDPTSKWVLAGCALVMQTDE